LIALCQDPTPPVIRQTVLKHTVDSSVWSIGITYLQREGEMDRIEWKRLRMSKISGRIPELSVKSAMRVGISSNEFADLQIMIST
jgi:hypothetical protein